MADIKRLHYFDHQFLVEADFTDEQKYHLDMRRRHNRVLHTFGVADGLQVEKTGDREITIRPGTALDRDGQEIVQAADHPIDLSNSAEYPPGTNVYVTIAYHEEETDPSTATGVTGNTRITEEPIIDASTTAPPGDGSIIRLARFALDGSGNVPGNIGDAFDNEVRQFAGPVIAPGAVGTDELADSAVTDSKLEGNAVTGNKLASNAVTSAKIAEADGTTTQNTNTGAGIKTGHIQNGAVTGAKIARNTISETKLDDATKGKLVTNGNGHDHSGGDGAQIRHSTLSKNDGRNPHGTTAADVGALVSVDGVGNPGGNIDLVRSNAITITPNDAQNRVTIGENHSARTNNPHRVTAAQAGALPTTGGTVTGSLDVRDKFFVRHSRGTGHEGAFVWHGHQNATWGLLARVTPTLLSSPGANKAAVAGVADISGVHGIYARAKPGTYSLYVQGTSKFTGAKTGYVVDTFRNVSGQRLCTGDVVKLKGTPIANFQGDNNKIPVAEVSLADKENDNMVIGIVDCEAIPEPDAPDTRVGPDDPTYIEDGGELLVVTLGAYAHCKVDATEAPIEVGDLLTTSSNPGHGKKATDPKIGSIIGKALEPIKEGTGYIAVFVNIQ
jgi:hypothetical protein